MFLAVVFPPFAVIDKGCGIYLTAFVLTCLGWVPGIIYAFVILKLEQRKAIKQNPEASHNRMVNKFQSKSSSSKKSSTRSTASHNDGDSSPFNRKRRMNTNDNSQSQGWQGWK